MYKILVEYAKYATLWVFIISLILLSILKTKAHTLNSLCLCAEIQIC